MSSEEDRAKHSRRRRRNRLAQTLRDPGERKGAFALKIVPSRTEYKRVRIDPKNIESIIDDETEI